MTPQRSWAIRVNQQLALFCAAISFAFPLEVDAAEEKLAGGLSHSVALGADGRVWTWGQNNYGQLGDGTTVVRREPAVVVGLSGVISVAAGEYFTLALKGDGTVWGWGQNSYGQLADGTATTRKVPIQVGGLTGIIAIAAGSSHGLALKNDGTVWVWGRNQFGQLGLGPTGPPNSLAAVSVANVSGAMRVSAGKFHSLVVLTNGTVLGWGQNTGGQLGDGTLTNRDLPGAVSGLSGVVELKAGMVHSLALKSDGSVWSWGTNSYGQLGDGTAVTRKTPVLVSGLAGGVQQIAGGDYHNLALKGDGTVWSWGGGTSGQLGNGEVGNKVTPGLVGGLTGATAVGAGTGFSLVALADGRVWAWGINDFGAVGTGEPTQEITPVELSGISGVTGIGAGLNQSYLRKSDGTIWSFGHNAYGQLGNGTLIYRAESGAAPGLNGVLSVVGGLGHGAALRSDGSVIGWGRNNYGQVGDNSTAQRATPVSVSGLTNGAIRLSAGREHTLAIKSDGTLWSWGLNTSGQLGDNTVVSKKVPQKINGITESVVDVAGGEAHSVAVTENGRVWTWGANSNQQLGNGQTAASLVPAQLAAFAPVIAVVSGGNHTLALDQTGCVWAWGLNTYGQVGNGTTVTVGSPTLVAGLTEVVAVAAMDRSSLALKRDGTVWSWGLNYLGQLGDGSNTQRTSPVPVNGLKGVVALAVGGDHVVALKEDGTIAVWGNAAYGQLGINEATYRLQPVEVGGVNLNQAVPTVNLNSAVSSVVLGQSLSLQPAVQPGAAAVAAVEFYNEGLKITETAGDWNWIPPTWGTYHLSAVARDVTGTHSLRSGAVVVTVPFDSDQNALPDWWELGYLGQLGNATYGDLDGDGATNLQEYEQETDPGDVASVPANLGDIQIVSGNLQTGVTNQYAPAALRVRVRNSTGQGLANVTVVYETLSGGGTLAATSGSASPQASLPVQTDANGQAEAFYQFGSNAGTSQVKATSLGQSVLFDLFAEAPVAPRGKVAAGIGHVLAVKEDGTVWAWGQNNYSQLGDNTTLNRNRPAQVTGLSHIVAVAAGDYFSLALDDTGYVWAWGLNSYGQLGDGTSVGRKVPKKIATLSGVTAIAAGSQFSLACTGDGKVWGFGRNHLSQLGDVSAAYKLAPTLIAGLTDVTAIAAGNEHALALNADGSVWAWGRNNLGQVGNNTTINQTTPTAVAGLSGGVVAIDSGYNHSLALKSDGRVLAWGQNNYGQLGDASATQRNLPVAVVGLSGVSAIGAGDYHSMAIKGDGSVWTWGSNANAQLGDGTILTRIQPTIVPEVSGGLMVTGGAYFSVAVKTDGKVLVWGRNDLGQSGDGRDPVRSNVAELENIDAGVEFGAGQQNSYLVKAGGTLWVTGSNAFGQLGDGSYVNQAQFTSLNVSNVKTADGGVGHTVVLKNDGSVWTWGRNNYGQLGDNTLTQRNTPLSIISSGVAQVAVGNEHTFAIKTDGTLWAWGYNLSGQLGDGTVVSQKLPKAITGVPNLRQVAAGGDHTLALQTNGTVWVWGSDVYGQLGDGGVANLSVPTALSLTGVAEVAAGESFSVALKTNGTVLTWGRNQYGQLGVNSADLLKNTPQPIGGLSNVIAIAAGGDHAYALKADGTVWAWGRNNVGQLGDGSLITRKAPVQVAGLKGVVALRGGYEHGIALKEDGTFAIWGSGWCGQLGLGITAFQWKPVLVPGIQLMGLSPQITFSNPTSPQTLIWGSSQTLQTTATAGSHPVQAVEFFNENNKLGESANGSFTWNANTWGTFQLTARSRDDSGYLSANSTQLTITVPFDSDANGLPDYWEISEFGHLGNVATADPDGDGLTNAQEYQAISDPENYFSQGGDLITPGIQIVSGNGQSGPPSAFLPNALVAKVVNILTGDPLTNAPVTFTVTSGGGKIALTNQGAPDLEDTLNITSGADGLASVYYSQGAVVLVTSIVSAQSGSAVMEFHSETHNPDPLVGHWRFDDGSGTLAADSSLNHHDGTLVNNPTWITRYNGERALEFSGELANGGNNSYLTMGNPADSSLNFETSDFSVVLWVKANEQPALARLVGKGQSDWTPGYALAITPDGEIEAALGTTETGNGSEGLQFKTPGNFDDNQWHHVAVIFDRVNAIAKVYVDGVAQTLMLEVGTGGALNAADHTLLEYASLENLSGATTENFTVASESGNSAFYNGGMDDLRVYRKALSEVEVQNLFEGDSPLSATAATATLDEDTLGVIQLQSSGGGNGLAAYSVVEQPENGEIELSGNTANYFPNAHFNGTDRFRFQVVKDGRVSEAQVNLTVTPVNDPPLVSVSGMRTVVLPMAAVIQGTVSDIDNPIEELTKTWSVVSGPGEVTFSSPDDLGTSAVFAEPGEYVLRLSVNDGTVLRSDSMVVVVNAFDATNLPSITFATPNQNATFGLNQNIGMSAVAEAGNGLTIAKVEFYEGSRKIGATTTSLPGGAIYQSSWNPERLGAFELSAIATDSAGNQMVSATKLVRVTEAGWFTGPGILAGNEGYAGSGGNGGIESGSNTAGNGIYAVGTGVQGGGASAGGGGNGYGGTTGSENSSDDDEDGVPDAVERNELGTNWKKTNGDTKDTDTDQDGVPDGEDAVPTVKEMTVKAAPESNYVIIDLGENRYPLGVNDNGKVLLKENAIDFRVWENGSVGPVIFSGNGPALWVYGPLQDGSIFYRANNFTNEYSTTDVTEPVNATIIESNFYQQRLVAGGGGNGNQHELIGYKIYNLENEVDVPDHELTLSILDEPASIEAKTIFQSIVSLVGNATNSTAGFYDMSFDGTMVSMNDAGGAMVRMVQHIEAWKDTYADGMVRALNGEAQICGVLSGGKVEIFSVAKMTWRQYANPIYHENEDFGFGSYDQHYEELSKSGKWTGKFLANSNGVTVQDNYDRIGLNPYFPNGVWNTGSPEVKTAAGTLRSCTGLYDLNALATPEGAYVLGAGSEGAGIWLANKPNISKKLQKISLSSEDSVVGRKISNKLVIPAGTNIWRNSRTRPIAELCGSPANWSGISVSQVSPDKNFLIGTAIKDENGDGQFQAGGSNPPDKSHGILLIPVEIDIMEPGSPADWSEKMPEKRVILFNENIRVRIRIPILFDGIQRLISATGLSTVKVKTFATKPDGININLDSQYCEFTQATDEITGASYSEVRSSLTREQLITWGLIANDQDNIQEKAWYDWGDIESSGTHDLSDGSAFNSTGTEKIRGQCTKYGTLKSTPRNSPYDKSFLSAGGVECVTVEFGGAVSSIRQVANQADVLYISAEGRIATGNLEVGDKKEAFSPGDTLWTHGLKAVIIAGCSVLAIRDYRVSSMTRGSRFMYFLKTGAYYTNINDPSPGIAWEETGPDYLLGYCFSAPADTQGSAQIISSYLTSVSSGVNPVAAWGLANTGNKGNNACAIDTSISPHEYWYFKSVDGKLIWTKVAKEIPGWPIIL